MTFANLIGGILFGGVGLIAFVYGKKQFKLKAMLIGIALMVYPYFIANTLALYLAGVILTLALFVFSG